MFMFDCSCCFRSIVFFVSMVSQSSPCLLLSQLSLDQVTLDLAGLESDFDAADLGAADFRDDEDVSEIEVSATVADEIPDGAELEFGTVCR